MSKILVINHGLETTGWGRAGRELLLALASQPDLDVVWRPVKLGEANYKPEGKLKELLEKSSEGAEICIQHVLPHFLSYNSAFKKNIAYFVAETLGWNASGWHHYINLMDELWVPNTQMAKDAKSFITCPIKVVPHATDTTKYSKEYNEKIDIPDLYNSYNFYFIGEYNRRKRLGIIIQAFNLEFKKTEQVNLILKVNKPGFKEDKLIQDLQNFCLEIKKGLKLYPDPSYYPREIIISSYMSEDDLMALHKACHCYVSGSHGEAWNYGAFDAMAMGNYVIHSNVGGPKDFLNQYWDGFKVSGRWTPCFANYETFPNYNSAREKWFDVDINNLRELMRLAYNERKNKRRKPVLDGEYSYEAVGKLMKGLLC